MSRNTEHYSSLSVAGIMAIIICKVSLFIMRLSRQIRHKKHRKPDIQAKNQIRQQVNFVRHRLYIPLQAINFAPKRAISALVARCSSEWVTTASAIASAAGLSNPACSRLRARAMAFVILKIVAQKKRGYGENAAISQIRLSCQTIHKKHRKPDI